MERSQPWDAVIIGGGLAGLSAAIYLARAQRSTLVIDDGNSLAQWEPDVQNYLGFPRGIAGKELLERGRKQAGKYGAEFAKDHIEELRRAPSQTFHAVGKERMYASRRILLATGLYHVPPDIPGVSECLGHSMFFCKDCDGVRCEGKRIGIFGWNDEAVEYALAMMLYSPCVFIFLHGHEPHWSERHNQWLREYEIPVYAEPVVNVHHESCEVKWLELAGDTRVELDALFTTRGDVYHNKLAHQIGAETKNGEVLVDERMQTTVRGLYAAGCVTPANCQMIIAAGEGATAAQAINRSLFEESLATHSLHRYRVKQLEHDETEPPVETVP
jgi:thioredoxin reductase (NADPH)